MTRPLSIIAGLLAIPVLTAEPGTQHRDLAALVGAAESSRDAHIQEVRSRRHYVVRNPMWDTDAIMEATMITSADGLKRYEVHSTNSTGMRKKILLKILDGEVEAAASRERDGSVNATNYELRPVDGTVPAGQSCRTVELVPKRRTRFTFEGRGCVDMTDMAMVRMEGQTAKRISFLVGKAYVVQDFKKVGAFWYSASSRSSAHVRLLGKTELIIQYQDYTITSKTGTVTSTRVAHEAPAAPEKTASRPN